MTHAPNFLRDSRRARIISGVWIWILAVFVAAVFVLPLASFGGAAAFKLAAAEDGFGRAEAALGGGDFKAAKSELDSAASALSAALTELEKIRIYEITPWLGRQIRGTRVLTEAGLLSAGAAADSIDLVREVAAEAVGADFAGFLGLNISPEATLSRLSREEKFVILSRIAQSAAKLERVRDNFAEASALIQGIESAGLFGPLRSAVERSVGELNLLTREFRLLVPILKTFPRLAGFPETSRSLILFLNNAELRPGGGFIGALGELALTAGEVHQLTTADSYSIDGPAEGTWIDPAPEPIRNYLGVEHWYLRDANWSPDFAVSAREILRHLEGELAAAGRRYEPHDFIIGFTPDFAASVLRITGPVTIDGQTFSPENLFAALEYQVEIGFAEQGIPKEQRKEILARLVDETVRRLSELPLGEWGRLLDAVSRAIEEKHLMFWSGIPELQEIFEKEGWAGRANFGKADFFMAVDSNMAALKTDVEIERSVEYKFAPYEDGFLGAVSVTYRHGGRFDWKTTRYRTYTRLYLPEGSEFVAVSGSLKDDKLKNPSREPGPVDVSGDLGAAVFGAFIAIEPGEERTLTFTFKLSPKVVQLIKDGKYELRAVKQLGAKAHDLTLDLDFDKKLEEAAPPESRAEWGDSSYKIRTKLSTDRVFRVATGN